MPKRSHDASTPVAVTAERAIKKTERSHEENQERAYIAASRRADRSIEARIQSARMASEIHKKRTGKGFKISEEIVMKEEMYEEEEDDLPRHYRALTAHLQTSSPDMNSRLNAYVTNQVAMASLARQQEIDRLFAEQFPNASQISQQLYKSTYYKPIQQQKQADSPTTPHFASVDFQSKQASARDRSRSVAQTSDAMSPRASVSGPSPLPRGSVDSALSPATPGSGSGSLDMADSRRASSYSSQYTTATTPVDTTTSMPPIPLHSAFTSELPPEVKQMVNLDMGDPLAASFLGGDYAGVNPGMDFLNFPAVSAEPSTTNLKAEVSSDEYFSSALHPQSRTLDLPGQRSTIGTPGGGAGDNWELWINSDWVAVDGDEHH